MQDHIFDVSILKQILIQHMLNDIDHDLDVNITRQNWGRTDGERDNVGDGRDGDGHARLRHHDAEAFRKRFQLK